MGTNRYAYASNDPVNLTDPTGNAGGAPDSGYTGGTNPGSGYDPPDSISGGGDWGDGNSGGGCSDGSDSFGSNGSVVPGMTTTYGQGALAQKLTAVIAAAGATEQDHFTLTAILGVAATHILSEVFLNEDAPPEEVPEDAPVTIGDKIQRQMGKRGWSEVDVQDAISDPAETHPGLVDSRHAPDGSQ